MSASEAQAQRKEQRGGQGQEARQFKISSWREAVVSVSDFRPHLKFFREVGGWEVISRKKLSPQQIAHWQLPSGVSGYQALLANPGTQSGFVRLVRFDGAERQVQVRSNTQPWDVGGLYDINVRVADMDAIFPHMQRLGWQGGADPARFNFGPFEVIEWLARGPDGLVLALIERLKPKLEGWPNLKKISRSFNSSQTVRDIKKSMAFYVDVLGFQIYLESKGASKPPGENVFGLPHNLAVKHEREIYIVHPDGGNEGSVELVAFDGLTGRDVSALGVPPNLGLLMLRFPTRNLAALERHLRANKVDVVNRIERFAIPPYGRVRVLSARSPEGAWLEFFELP